MESSFRNYLQHIKIVLQRINTFLKRVNTLLGKFEIGVLCLIVAMLVGLAVLKIVARYILPHFGIQWLLSWSAPMLQHLILWLCFFGAALASCERRHISIDILSRILPKRIMRFSSYIIDIISLIIVSILAYFGFEFLMKEQDSPATLIGPIPLWWAKTIIPIGFILIGIHLVLQIFINLTEREHPQADIEGEVD